MNKMHLGYASVLAVTASAVVLNSEAPATEERKLLVPVESLE